MSYEQWDLISIQSSEETKTRKLGMNAQKTQVSATTVSGLPDTGYPGLISDILIAHGSKTDQLVKR